MEEKEKDIAKYVYYLSEDGIYQIIEKFNNDQMVDKSLVYCFIKAFFIYVTKLYINNKKLNLEFDNIYFEYKENLKLYYQTNNPNIEEELLDQVLNFFDNSFSMIASVQVCDIEDSYEFRHYTINLFELLKMILEKKSNSIIRNDIFDSYIKVFLEQTEEIFWYVNRLK